MQKCLPLNLLEPTKAKERLLRETYLSFFGMVEEALNRLDGVKSRAELHNETYEDFRGKYRVASQLAIEAASYAWSIRRTVDKGIGKCVVRFDGRLFSFQETRKGNPVLSLRLNHSRIGLPISRDGAYRRLREHLKEGWKATSTIMKRSHKFLVVLRKEMPRPTIRTNTMGVDMNSSKIAVSIIGNGEVLKQAYFGRDLSTRQFLFEERRAKLQEYRDTVSRGKAGLKLKRLSGKQRNYVRTTMWQMANQIVKLAEDLDANIAIEGLEHLRKRKGEWSRKSTRKVNRIPYGFFRHALKHVAEREGVIVKETRPNYTSQTCPRCRHMGRQNWKGYSYFKCVRCGYEADRDRTASLNIALRAAPEVAIPKPYFVSQIPKGDAPVSGHVLQDEGVERPRQTHHELQAPDFSQEKLTSIFLRIDISSSHIAPS